MTSFRVKLIEFGPTRSHFLPGYFPPDLNTEKGGGWTLQNMKENRDSKGDNQNQKDKCQERTRV